MLTLMHSPVKYGSVSNHLILSSHDQNVEGTGISLGGKNIRKVILFAPSLPAFSIELLSKSHIVKIKEVFKKEKFLKD